MRSSPSKPQYSFLTNASTPIPASPKKQKKNKKNNNKTTKTKSNKNKSKQSNKNEQKNKTKQTNKQIKKPKPSTVAPELVTLDGSLTHVLLVPNTQAYHSW